MNAKNIIIATSISLFLMTNISPSFAQTASKASSTKKTSKLKKSQKGAVIGAGTGAVVGGIIGKNKNNTAIGAIIGATVGGAAGAVIGDIMDKKAEKLREDLGDKAKVERVGEGVKLTMGDNLLFDFGSSVLLPETMISLRNMTETLKKDGQVELLIEGNTDSIGSADFNRKLSEMRGKAVGNFLISEGIASNRIKIVGMGESNPVASNNSDAGRQQNRRVEIGIYASDDMKNGANKAVSIR